MNAQEILNTAFLRLCQDEISGFELALLEEHALDWDAGDAEEWLTLIAQGDHYLSLCNDGFGLHPCLRGC